MTSVGRFKKGLAVVLASLMILTMLPGGLLKVEAAESDKTTLSINDGSIVIGNNTVSQNENSLTYNANGYIITGSGTTTNTISVTGGSQDITLSGVNIDVSSEDNKCAFSIDSGASVNLTLSVSNTLKSSGERAGLEVPKGASVNIAGTGSLSAVGGNSNFDYDECYGGGAGIGSGNGGLGSGSGTSGGSVTISGGTVTATGSNGGAGIGDGASASGGNVIISGGMVTANAGVDTGSGGSVGGAGIGGGECGSGGSTVISGGTVVANGGCGGAGIGSGDLSSGGSLVISGGSVKATSVTGGVTDGSGNTEHCVTVTGLTATANVNASVNGGKTFSCETDSSGQLYLWMAAGNDKATICCDNTYYGANAAVSDTDTSTAAGTMTVLNVSQEDITITDSGVTGKDSEGGDVSAANEYGYVISGTATVHTISITGGTHSIVLKGVDIGTSGGAFSISSGTVYLTSCGQGNKLTSGDSYAGLDVSEGAALYITGRNTDTLKSSGGFMGAGIGGNKECNCGTLTINGGAVSVIGGDGGAGLGGGWHGTCGKISIGGGIVTAQGGYGAAGIGGGTVLNGGTIMINGGKISATGIGGAGIGGGLSGSGSSITITGGTIKAKSEAAGADIGCGDGIGSGYYEYTYSKNSDSIKISGGSADVSSISGTPTSDGSTPVYPTTVTLPSGTNVSALSITQNSSYSYGFTDMQADSNGTLYLYLPGSAADDDTEVSVTADGTAYNGYHGEVKASGTQANPNVLKMNQSAFSFKNTYKQTFTYGDTNSLDTAVTGGTLSGTISYTYSGEDKLGNTYAASAACPTNAGDGDYTITATLPGNSCYYDATATKTFVISQKDISTNGVAVAAHSATYNGAALSPVITATFGSNSLVGGTDYVVYDGTGGTKNPTYTNAGSYSIMVKGTDNYTGNLTKTYTIAQKPITISLAASQSEAKAGGSVNLTAAVSSDAVNLPAGTVTFEYTGTTIASGVNITESDGKYTAHTTWNNVPAGEYTLTAEYVPAANDNYTCSAKAEIDNYSITKYDQTGFGFSAQTITKTFGDSDFTVTASGGQGGGAVTYQSSDENIAEVTDAGVVTIKKAGTATITATKASDSTYNEASGTITIIIGKAATSIKTVPAASDIEVVGKLSSVALTGGEGSVAGTFAWTDPDTVVSESSGYEVTFIPADSTDYSACTCKVKVKVTPVITNSGTGVQYDLSDAGLPDGVTSVSARSSALSETGSGKSVYSVVGNLIAGSTSAAFPSAVEIYSLSLTDQSGRALTGFTGKIILKIPIPGGMSGNLHVYWYDDQHGTLTDMNAKQENGYLVFETTHFSYYTVAELTSKSITGSGTSPSSNTSSSDLSSGTISNPDTGNSSFPFLLIALFGISGCGLVVVKRGRRFKKLICKSKRNIL